MLLVMAGRMDDIELAANHVRVPRHPLVLGWACEQLRVVEPQEAAVAFLFIHIKHIVASWLVVVDAPDYLPQRHAT